MRVLFQENSSQVKKASEATTKNKQILKELKKADVDNSELFVSEVKEILQPKKARNFSSKLQYIDMGGFTTIQSFTVINFN